MDEQQRRDSPDPLFRAAVVFIRLRSSGGSAAPMRVRALPAARPRRPGPCADVAPPGRAGRAANGRAGGGAGPGRGGAGRTAERRWVREPGRRGMAAGGALKALLLLLALLVLAAGALGKPTARQERARPGTAQHEDKSGFQYDHEAFLGKEEARSFDQLSPEESRERLG